MRVSSKRLKRIIQEELSLIEGCGDVEVGGSGCPACAAGQECPCGDEGPLGDFGDLNVTNASPEEAFSAGEVVGRDEELLSKEEALRIVEAIANHTSCPVTKSALLDVVHNLGGSEGEEWDFSELDEHEGEACEDAHPESSHEDWEISSPSAFGAGFDTGTREREEFSYTGDLPRTASDSAELGYKAGIMGLDNERRSGG